MSNKSYYLGLDLGISSVGWAVMAKEDNKYYIDDFGVRLFDSSEKPNDGTTNAEERRNFRSARRLIRRRKQRIEDLKRFLENNNIISKKEIADFFSPINNIKITNNITYDNTKFFNPYVIRAKALKEKVSPIELAIILINIANHRGYNDKFSFKEEKETKISDKKNNDSIFDSAIKKAENLVENHNTIACAVINNEEFKNQKNNNVLGTIRNIKTDGKVNYNYLFAREAYQKELKLILEKQAEYYRQLSREKINELINNIILRQRDFEVGPGPKDEKKKALWETSLKSHQLFKFFLDSKGQCNQYKAEKRGFRSSLVFDLFQLTSALSTFTVKYLKPEDTKKIVQSILIKIHNGEEINKSSIKNIIIEKTSFKDFKKNDAWNNKNMVIKLSYYNALRILFLENLKEINFHNLENNIFQIIGKTLHENITPKRRKEKLNDLFKENDINLSKEQFDKLFIESFKGISTGACTNSFKYMQEAINAFIDGKSYGDFQAEFNKNNGQNIFACANRNIKELFQPFVDKDMQRNAVVFRAINQTRKVVKALHKKYGFFQVINVEIARKMGKSFKQREQITKNNEISFNERIVIEKYLEENDIFVNSTNIKKYRLWEQQLKKCLYCQKDIKVKDFEDNVLQIDHIIPQSIISDDSMNNLVLVCSECNQEKSKRTPLQWLKNFPDKESKYSAFLNQIKSKISDQKLKYLTTENIDDEQLNDFASRNLNDTRYITRYVVNWLKKEFSEWIEKTGEYIPTEVRAINGMVTSRFRKNWLYDSAWGLEKQGNDTIIGICDITPFHHAVDAIILTQFKNYWYITFASDIIKINNLKYKLKKRKITEKEFKNESQEVLKKWESDKMTVLHASSRLKKLIADPREKNNLITPLVSRQDLLNVVNFRIPVELEKQKITKSIDLKQRKNKEQILPENSKKEIKFDIPKFIRVLNQEEYNQRLKSLTLKGDLHYPFISYKVDYKLSGSLTSSQLPVNSHYKFKKDKDDKKIKVKHSLYENQELKPSFIKDKNNTYWEINNYYGVVIGFEEKPVWIRRTKDIKQELEKYKDCKIIVPKNIIEYVVKKELKKAIKIYHGKMGSKVLANLLGINNIQKIAKNKEIFIQPNYYDSISNWKDLKILNISILGKRL